MDDPRDRDPALDDATVTGGGESNPDDSSPPHPSRGHGPRVGERIGAYLLTRKLGEGGMGIVFEATQEHPIRRTVALKVTKPGMDSAKVLARFEAERQALALMGHPNIARVYDAGMTETGHPYFVMEYAPGAPLIDYCEERKRDLRQRLGLFIDVCRGVQHAHQKGIVHRDLKPSNILVHDRDGEDDVKIIDFGIARATDPMSPEWSTMTEAGQLVGTPAYMSPEQATRGNVDIDTRTDIYSLGVVLYELVSGKLPFDFADAYSLGVEEVLRRIREVTPEHPSRRLSLGGAAPGEGAPRVRSLVTTGGFSRDLDWITMRALEKDRERRYDSAADFARDISCFLNDEPVSAGPPSLSYRAQKFVRRHRLAVAFSVLLVLSLVAGATTSALGFVRASRAEKQARYEADTSAEVIDFLVRLFNISDPGEARGNQVTAREILDRGVDTIQEEWTDRPDVRGRLLETMGLVYRSLGLYGVSQTLLERAVEDCRHSHGEQSAELADALNSLAGLLLIQRRGGDALPYLREAEAIQRAVLEETDLRRARTLNNLGLAARLADRPDVALAYYQESLDLRRAGLGENHPDLIGPMSNIASMYRAQGKDDESRVLYEGAIAIAEAELPGDHPDLARLLNNLATLHRTFGRHDQALAALRQVLEIRERVLGPAHPDLVPALVSLGELYVESDEPEQALAAFDRALAIGETTLPEGHPLVEQARAGRISSADRQHRAH